jgi:hypothetical protein
MTPDHPDQTPHSSAPRRDMAPRFQWIRCPEHPELCLSVIRVPGCADWCVGDPDRIHGHPVEVAA